MQARPSDHFAIYAWQFAVILASPHPPGGRRERRPPSTAVPECFGLSIGECSFPAFGHRELGLGEAVVRWLHPRDGATVAEVTAHGSFDTHFITKSRRPRRISIHLVNMPSVDLIALSVSCPCWCFSDARTHTTACRRRRLRSTDAQLVIARRWLRELTTLKRRSRTSPSSASSARGAHARSDRTGLQLLAGLEEAEMVGPPGFEPGTGRL